MWEKKRTPVVIQAKRDGACTLCGKVYHPGTRIVLDRDTNEWVMADCLWPGKGKAKSLKLNAESENPSLEVAARLAIAVDILCERFGIGREEVNPDSCLLAEIMRQLYGQKWLGKDMG